MPCGMGSQSRWWGTFPMWKSLGCNIQKRPSNVEEGHWGCRVVFWKPVTKTVVDDQTGDEEDERFFVLRTYTLFSADQVEGEGAEQYQVHEEAGQPHAEPDFQPAEELIVATGADIRHGGERAFYDHDRRLHPAALPGAVRHSRCLLRDGPPRTCPLERTPPAARPSAARLRHVRAGGGDGGLLRRIGDRRAARGSLGEPCRPTSSPGWRD